MNGVSGFKNQKKMAYYACSKRLATHDCEQAYMRSYHVEEAILEDLKSIFQDEELVAKVCEEVNKILAAEGPEIDRQLVLIDSQMAQARERRGRYFEAFEARTLDSKVCNEKLAEVDAQIASLDAERARLTAQRERLDLLTLDRELIAALMANFDQVFACGTTPQKKTPPPPHGEGGACARSNDRRGFLRGAEPRCGSHTDTNGSPTASVCEPQPAGGSPWKTPFLANLSP